MIIDGVIWSVKPKFFALEDARYVAGMLNFRGSFEEFLMGLNVEGEHGDVADLVKEPRLVTFGYWGEENNG